MNIGVFDSGIGGLLTLRAIVERLPQYDYIYFGDTQRAPYGERSQEVIYEFTQEAVEFLFEQDCNLIILACNTASARALRRIQQEYLPKQYPDRRVLGVIIPTVEAAIELSSIKKVGVLATTSTVESGTFVAEFKKINPTLEIIQQSAQLLVPLIENNGTQWEDSVLHQYLQPFHEANVDALVLGCTHYPLVKDRIRKIVGNRIVVVSQDEIIPQKLQNYLHRHPEFEATLAKNGLRTFLATDKTPQIEILAKEWFGDTMELEVVDKI